MRRHLLAIPLCFLGLSPAAVSAAEWRDVGQISPTGQEGQVHAQGVDAAGNYTALFRPVVGVREEELGEEFPAYGPLQARERAPRGRFVTRPGFDATNARLAVAPGGERIAASITGPAGNLSIEVRRRLPGRNWSEPQVVATGQVRPYDNLGVEVAPTGEAVVWWTDERVAAPQPRSALMVAVRPAGATTFSPAEPLAEGRLSPAAVQLDADGNAVASWGDRDAGALRIARRPAASVWNAPESFAIPGRSVIDDFDAPRLAVAPNGRAVVTWSVGVDGHEFSGGIAAIAGSATGPFGTPVVLSDRGSASAAATDGTLSAITWAENPGAKGRVRAVLLVRGADLASAPERVVSGTAVPYGVGQVTVAKRRATFAWLRRVAGPRVVEARTATIDGRFTRAQTLSSRRETASNVAITTSSRGEPWVAWAGQERGGNNRHLGASAAKASTRTGKFSRSVVIVRGQCDRPPALLAGRRGTMFAATTRKNAWYLRAYGER